MEINAPWGEPVRVNISADQPVIVDKMFGPLVFTAIRVTADFKTCEWVVERQTINTGEWVEAIRIPGQRDEEFAELGDD